MVEAAVRAQPRQRGGTEIPVQVRRQALRRLVRMALFEARVERVEAVREALVGRCVLPLRAAGADAAVEIRVGHGAVVVAVVAARFVAHQQRGVRRQRQERGQARGARVLVQAQRARRVRAVLQEAVPFVPRRGGAQRQHVVHGHVDHGAEPARAPVAERGVDVALEAAHGRLRDDVDDAGRRVAAVQRALRAAQHFHAVDVVEGRVLALRTRDVDAVDHEGGRRVALLGDVGVRYAADRDAQAVVGILEERVRQACADRAGRVRADRIEALAREDAQRDRRLRCRRGGALRRDDHFLDTATLGTGRLSVRRRVQRTPGDRGHRRGEQVGVQPTLLFFHGLSPVLIVVADAAQSARRPSREFW